MKHVTIYKHLLGVILSICFLNLDAQQYSTGAPGTGGNTIPWAYNATGCRGQQLYPASVFASVPSGNQITKVYWASTTTGTATYGTIEIYLKQANIASLTTAYETGMTLVYSGNNVTVSRTALQYYGFDLQTPFPFDPTLPLIWEVKQIMSPYVSFSSSVHTPTPAGAFRNYATGINATIATGAAAYSLSFGIDVEPMATGPDNAGVTKIIEPADGCEGTYNVTAEIRNMGINQITSVLVDWSLNGTPQATYTHTAILDTNKGSGPNSAVVTLGTVTLPGGTNTIKAWTTMPNNVPDTSNKNDTTSKIYNSLPLITTFPYYEDFESGQGPWFSGGSNSTWAFGTPAKTNISGAASGVNAWIVGGLTGTYNNSENSYVNSPCFDLTQFEGDPWVALNLNWWSEFSWDGAVLQTSINGGATWQNVGAMSDPFNWYNDNTINGNPGGQQIGWSGNATTGSNGWKRAKHGLVPSLVGKNVRFRVAFGSDASVNTYDGFAFDNFTIVDYKRANLGPDVLSMCGKSFTELDPHVNFNGFIKWSTGDSINETINANTTGSYWVMYTDSMIDVTSYDTIELIQSVPPQIQFAAPIDTIRLSGSAILDPNTNMNLTYDWQPGNYTFPYLFVKGSDYGLGTHTFSLTVTDSLLCNDQEQVSVVVIKDHPIGIDENEAAGMSFYPNPVQDELNIRLDGFDNSPVNMQITDIQGRTHMNVTYDHVQGQTHQMDLSSLLKGAYILRVQSDTKQATVRLIVD